MVNKPKGGKGQRAPYETVMVRTPLPVKPDVEALISRYRDSVLHSGVAVNESQDKESYSVSLKLVYKFIEESGLAPNLHTRNNVNLIRFRDWLQSKLTEQ